MKLKEYEKMFQLQHFHWFFVCKRMFIAAFLKKFSLPKNYLILDAGCGCGANHLFLQNYGKVVSLDMSPYALQFCRKKKLNRLIQGDLNCTNFKEATFNMAAAIDVLYHSWIKDDKVVLKKFYRALKPGGWLLITDSAFQFLVSRHDKAVMTRERYTVQDLRIKLENAGFKIKRSSYMFLTTFPILVIIRYIQKFSSGEEAESNVFPLPVWINKLILFIMNLEGILLSRISLPFGSSVIILAEKTK